jgi:hypothetical protein
LFWDILKSQNQSQPRSRFLRNGNFLPNRFPGPTTSNDSGIKRLFLTQMVRAKRAGTWFRLPRQERGMFELAMRLDVKLQSHDLLKALVSVLRNLRERFDREFGAFVRATRIAWAFSEAAAGWGNETARGWRNDISYVRYLAMEPGSHHGGGHL